MWSAEACGAAGAFKKGKLSINHLPLHITRQVEKSLLARSMVNGEWAMGNSDLPLASQTTAIQIGLVENL